MLIVSYVRSSVSACTIAVVMSFFFCIPTVSTIQCTVFSLFDLDDDFEKFVVCCCCFYCKTVSVELNITLKALQ